MSGDYWQPETESTLLGAVAGQVLGSRPLGIRKVGF